MKYRVATDRMRPIRAKLKSTEDQSQTIARRLKKFLCFSTISTIDLGFSTLARKTNCSAQLLNQNYIATRIMIIDWRVVLQK